MQNKIIIKKEAHEIGKMDAENDKFLERCFVENISTKEIQDDHSKILLVGRTGAGKTAILKIIKERNKRNSHQVDLMEISMIHLESSSTVRLLSEMGANLKILFKALWQHILILEYIRIKYDISNEQKSKNLIDKIVNFFNKNRKKREEISKYIKKWSGGGFFVSSFEKTENILKKIGEDVENKLSASARMPSNISGIEVKEGERKFSEIHIEKKANICDEYIKNVFVRETYQIIRDISEYEKNNKDRNEVFILIDRIDEDWADEYIKNIMIEALIDSAISMKKIPNSRVIISIRSDIYESIINKLREEKGTMQSEKYMDYISEIVWDKDSLEDLVNKRINFLFKSKYTKDSVNFYDIFPDTIPEKERGRKKAKGRTPTFEYLIERTLMRPRDIILFINECFKLASYEQLSITPTLIRRAEKNYSTSRLKALIEEWKGVFFWIEIAIDYVSHPRKKRVKVEEIIETIADRFINEVLSLKDVDQDDYIVKRCNDWMNEENERILKSIEIDILNKLLSALFLAGFIGIKEEGRGTVFFGGIRDSIYNFNEGNISSFVIHKMLHSALNIQ